MDLIEPPAHVIRAAIEAACNSPCDKSKRGAAVFERGIAGRLVATGWNGRPGDPPLSSCGGACRSVCRDVAVHAEERAIIDALRVRPVAGLELVHVKVVGGELVAGGGPSCSTCSRTILDTGIAAVWLYEELGAPGETVAVEWAWRRYHAHDFHELSLRANKLETTR